jgi:hypothetical protein
MKFPNWNLEMKNARTHYYSDVCHLNAIGYWPNHKVPRWVKDLTKQYGSECHPTSPCIMEYAYVKEIEFLRDKLLDSYFAV